MQESQPHPYRQSPSRLSASGLGPRHPRRRAVRPTNVAPAPTAMPQYSARPVTRTPAGTRSQPAATARSNGRSSVRNLWDLIWKDDDGQVVIWQIPNAWLIGWAVFTTVSLFFNGHTADVLSLIASASLIIWSFLEIFRGVDYFRRLLGLVVVIYAVAALIKTF